MKNIKIFENYTKDEIQKDITDIDEKVKEIKNKLILKIKDLPQNNNITKNSDNSFIINKRNLDNNINLSPESYDYRYQYEQIINKINNLNHVQIIPFLEKITKEAKVSQFKNGTNKTVYLSKDVIEYLKNILDM